MKGRTEGASLRAEKRPTNVRLRAPLFLETGDFKKERKKKSMKEESFQGKWWEWFTIRQLHKGLFLFLYNHMVGIWFGSFVPSSPLKPIGSV